VVATGAVHDDDADGAGGGPEGGGPDGGGPDGGPLGGPDGGPAGGGPGGGPEGGGPGGGPDGGGPEGGPTLGPQPESLTGRLPERNQPTCHGVGHFACRSP
jgi:hypothetical protein